MKIAAVIQDFMASNQLLQPWRYYKELLFACAEKGHEVTIFSNRGWPGELPINIQLWKNDLVGSRSGRDQSALIGMIRGLNSELIFWPLTPSSFLYLQRKEDAKAGERWAGFFPGPIPSTREILRVGARTAYRERAYVANHLVSALVPRAIVARGISGLFHEIWTMDHATANVLCARYRIPRTKIRTLPIPRTFEMDRLLAIPLPTELDIKGAAYAGPPLSIRGADIFVKAIRGLRHRGTRIEAQMFIRQQAAEYAKPIRRLGELTASSSIPIDQRKLMPEQLWKLVQGIGMLVAPFQLVQSGVPIILLEALAAGVPVVTTRLASIRAYVPDACCWYADPGDAESLAKAIADAMAHPDQVHEKILAGRELVNALITPQQAADEFLGGLHAHSA